MMLMLRNCKMRPISRQSSDGEWSEIVSSWLRTIIDHLKERRQKQHFLLSKCKIQVERNQKRWYLSWIILVSPGEMQTSLSSLSVQKGEAIINCSWKHSQHWKSHLQCNPLKINIENLTASLSLWQFSRQLRIKNRVSVQIKTMLNQLSYVIIENIKIIIAFMRFVWSYK